MRSPCLNPGARPQSRRPIVITQAGQEYLSRMAAAANGPRPSATSFPFRAHRSLAEVDAAPASNIECARMTGQKGTSQ